MRIAIIGHGRSPEGTGWGRLVDGCDAVVRMWDHAWQDPADYGARYDYGLIEIHPAMLVKFYQHNRRQPRLGWIGSVIGQLERCEVPPKTELVNQERWNEVGKRLGGLGKTGRLQFTRGTIATCWVIEKLAKPGDEIILVGFDNIAIGRTLAMDAAFSPAYRANPGTFSFAGYRPGESKFGNHDYRVERPVMELLAERRGVRLAFATDVWTGGLGVEQVEKELPMRRPGPTALVLGDGAAVYAEAESAQRLFTPDAVAACNNIGTEWPGRLDYWFTLHPTRVANWAGIADALMRREKLGRNRPQTWCHRHAIGVDRTTGDWAGSSGLFAVKALLEEGFERIVLAGVPLEGPHFYSAGKPWLQARTYQKGWNNHHEEIAVAVRSMSGFTRELLGEPTPAWLATP